MKPSDAAGRPSLFGRLRRVIRHSPVGRGWRRGRELELGSRSLGFAALGFLTLVPLQTGYERVWELSPARWYARWRHVLWLVVLVGYLFTSATTTLWRQSLALTSAALLSAVVFFWWSQRILLGGRVGWGALLPGAVATVIGLIGLRVFSRLVSPLIASSAATYGAIGTVLVVQSWLVGAGVVVFGGALVGRLVLQRRHR